MWFAASSVASHTGDAAPGEATRSVIQARLPEMPRTSSEVTRLLDAWSAGDAGALDDLMPLVLDDLRDLARRHLRGESPVHTLQPTALVNEVYLRLVDRRKVYWENRAQFFGFLATLMRRILVDHARRHRSAKRGGGVRPHQLDEAIGRAEHHPEIMERLDDALLDLAKVDPRQAQIVELHFFTGLKLRQIADVLDVSLRTVNRDWRTARLWLKRELQES